MKHDESERSVALCLPNGDRRRRQRRDEFILTLRPHRHAPSPARHRDASFASAHRYRPLPHRHHHRHRRPLRRRSPQRAPTRPSPWRPPRRAVTRASFGRSGTCRADAADSRRCTSYSRTATRRLARSTERCSRWRLCADRTPLECAPWDGRAVRARERRVSLSLNRTHGVANEQSHWTSCRTSSRIVRQSSMPL
jgi:hypothetical protein